MRKAPLAAITLVASSVFIGACGEEPPVKDPSAVSAKSSGDDSGKSSKGSGSETAAAPAEIKCVGKPDVGKPATTFSLAAVNGGKAGIEKGKVTIVDFWATWCGPCSKSFPKYQELYVKYKASGLEIVGVSVDDADSKKEIPAFLTTYGAKFPVAWDGGHKIAECYQPPNMPTAYVIDKNGVIKHIHHGYHDGEEKELEKEIKALL